MTTPLIKQLSVKMAVPSIFLADGFRIVSCLRFLGPRWEYIWIVALPLYIRRLPHYEDLLARDDNEMEAAVKATLRKFVAFKDTVYRYQYDKLWLMKPVLRGNQVISLLKIVKPGLYVHRILCELVVWQVMQMPALYPSPLPEFDETKREESVSAFIKTICPSQAEAFVKHLDATQKTMLLDESNYPPKLF
jgi:hypothetical protein